MTRNYPRIKKVKTELKSALNKNSDAPRKEKIKKLKARISKVQAELNRLTEGLKSIVES